jgi:oleate hydratase
MYYGSGNYEAFAHARRPAGVDGRSAYLIGAGLASLAAAAFLVRDAQMDGSRIHILERDPRPGGGLDGWFYPDLGYTMRGGREMGHHYECFWDLFRDIPSAEDPQVSVLDYYYWLNKDDPDYTLCRATRNRGEDAHTDGKFNLSDQAALQIARLFFTPDADLYYKRIDEVFDDEVLNSTFWMYWRTMFAFENWHSALEMKRYIQRFIHHVGGLPDFSALRFSRYNQYESFVVPLVRWLEERGVQFHYGVEVLNVLIDTRRLEPGAHGEGPQKVATRIVARLLDGTDMSMQLGEDDLVFITNGSLVSHAAFGSQTEPASYDPDVAPGDCWSLWRNIAAQDRAFGKPDVFCGDPDKSTWMSATVTTLDGAIPPYIQAICHRDPFSGRTVTGGIVTAEDSKWLLSWTVNRQPQFQQQRDGTLTVWVYALFCDVEGDFVKKPMRDCTGVEVCQEWLYHLGVPEDLIVDLAENHANTVPCMLPYITAFFMPRSDTDRPLVVPEHARNFAFIGQFAETERDVVFTIEYAVRTAMEAVYTLLDVDRAVPEVWGSAYDVRCLLNAAYRLRDDRPLESLKVNPAERLALRAAIDRTKDTDIYLLLQRYGLVEGGTVDPRIM